MNSISSVHSLRPDILLLASLLGRDYACGQRQQLNEQNDLNELNELKEVNQLNNHTPHTSQHTPYTSR